MFAVAWPPQQTALFDHLVGAGAAYRWYFEASHLAVRD
jgi:hypothetical protein